MEAKDTVIKCSIKRITTPEEMQTVLKSQAEKTWPVAFKAGMREGRKDILDWLHTPCPHTGGPEEEQMYVEACPKCCQSKLKEWV